MNNKAQKLTGQEKVEHYLNIWGSDKRTLMSILRQIIFILGIISTIVVAGWVVMHALSFYFNNTDFTNITERLAKVSIVFIAFIIVLDGIYICSELFSLNKNRLNRIPSLVVGGCIWIIFIVFMILTCIELFGIKDVSRSYIYCIYLVICFSCTLFSTIYCFDAKQKNVKFNPNRKLLKTLSYTIGFLGILAVLSFILWIMWYGGSKENLVWTCFILARTIITLIGSIIVKLITQIILMGVLRRQQSNHKKSRIVWLSILFATMFGLEFGLGWCFYLSGPWQTNFVLCKAIMCVTIIVVIAVSAIDIAIASKYAQSLEKEVEE